MNPIKTTMGGVEWTLLVAISICWGSSFFFNRVAVVEIPVFTVVLGRVAIGAALIYLFTRARGLSLPRDIQFWRELGVLSILQYSAPLTLIVWSQQSIPSGLASILNTTTPIWAAIAAHLVMQDERLTPSRIAGVLVGIGGVVAMIGPQTFGGMHGNLLPELASLLAAVCFGVAAVYTRRLQRLKVPNAVSVTGSMMLGSLTLLPLVLLIDRPWNLPAEPSLAAWSSVIALGLFAGAIAFIMFFDLVRRAGATNAALVTILNPVTAILLGVLLLDETLAPRHYFGVALVALGFIILDGRVLVWARAKLSYG